MLPPSRGNRTRETVGPMPRSHQYQDPSVSENEVSRSNSLMTMDTPTTKRHAAAPPPTSSSSYINNSINATATTSRANALRQVLRSSGINANSAFQQHNPPSLSWVNDNITTRDTVATVELVSLSSLSSTPNNTTLELTVMPDLPNRMFPTACIISVASVGGGGGGGTLPDVADLASREVVVKEWKLPSSDAQGQPLSLHSTTLSMKTVLNVISVLATTKRTDSATDLVDSDGNRVFLSLRFVGCNDMSQCHRIRHVSLQYLTAGSAATVMRMQSPPGGAGAHEQQRKALAECMENVMLSPMVVATPAHTRKQHQAPGLNDSVELEIRMDLSPLQQQQQQQHAHQVPPYVAATGPKQQQQQQQRLNTSMDGVDRRSASPREPSHLQRPDSHLLQYEEDESADQHNVKYLPVVEQQSSRSISGETARRRERTKIRTQGGQTPETLPPHGSITAHAEQQQHPYQFIPVAHSREDATNSGRNRYHNSHDDDDDEVMVLAVSPVLGAPSHHTTAPPPPPPPPLTAVGTPLPPPPRAAPLYVELNEEGEDDQDTFHHHQYHQRQRDDTLEECFIEKEDGDTNNMTSLLYEEDHYHRNTYAQGRDSPSSIACGGGGGGAVGDWYALSPPPAAPAPAPLPVPNTKPQEKVRDQRTVVAPSAPVEVHGTGSSLSHNAVDVTTNKTSDLRTTALTLLDSARSTMTTTIPPSFVATRRPATFSAEIASQSCGSSSSEQPSSVLPTITQMASFEELLQNRHSSTTGVAAGLPQQQQQQQQQLLQQNPSIASSSAAAAPPPPPGTFSLSRQGSLHLPDRSSFVAVKDRSLMSSTASSSSDCGDEDDLHSSSFYYQSKFPKRQAPILTEKVMQEAKQSIASLERVPAYSTRDDLFERVGDVLGVDARSISRPSSASRRSSRTSSVDSACAGGHRTQQQHALQRHASSESESRIGKSATSNTVPPMQSMMLMRPTFVSTGAASVARPPTPPASSSSMPIVSMTTTTLSTSTPCAESTTASQSSLPIPPTSSHKWSNLYEEDDEDVEADGAITTSHHGHSQSVVIGAVVDRPDHPQVYQSLHQHQGTHPLQGGAAASQHSRFSTAAVGPDSVLKDALRLLSDSSTMTPNTSTTSHPSPRFGTVSAQQPPPPRTTQRLVPGSMIALQRTSAEVDENGNHGPLSSLPSTRRSVSCEVPLNTLVAPPATAAAAATTRVTPDVFSRTSQRPPLPPPGAAPAAAAGAVHKEHITKQSTTAATRNVVDEQYHVVEESRRPSDTVLWCHKHHTTRNGTGRRCILLHTTPDGEGVTFTMKKPDGSSWKGPAEAIDSPQALVTTGEGLNGGARGDPISNTVMLERSAFITVLVGVEAYNHSSIHRNRVHCAGNCVVVLRKGRLVTSLELDTDSDVARFLHAMAPVLSVPSSSSN